MDTQSEPIPEPQPSAPLKFVYHELDQNIIGSMLVLMLASSAQLKLADVKHRDKIDNRYIEYLIAKADVHGDLGGARIAYVLVSVLKMLFIGVMNVPKERAEILIQMIFSMAANGLYNATGPNQEAPEGPKRG